MQKDERDLLEVLKFELQFLRRWRLWAFGEDAPEASVYFRRFSHLYELRFQRESQSMQ
jgi:hypothetical protein